MVINKKIALFFLSTNIAYVGLWICIFFILHETVSVNLNEPPVSIAVTSAWFIIPTILNLILFVGLFWVVQTLGEKWWVKTALIIIFVMKLAWLMVQYTSGYYTLFRFVVSNPLFSQIGLGFTLVLLVMLFFLVRSRLIRKYFRTALIIIIISTIAPTVGGYLYDNFVQANWLLINSEVLLQLFFVVTLIMFTKVYNLSGKEIFSPGKTDIGPETL